MFPDRLARGYRAFRSGRFTEERSRYEMLAETGQRPEIMVVGCVDSRVSPEVIFDAAPGEML
ncbi:MAG: carbonic anhydrase, partial [Methylobacteriaceae bacterium]|nr:carbonic anhydrase [Methylobacteriaceae bacterium]